jgi:hypothetical protein
MAPVFDQHRNGNARRVHRGKRDEPGVILQVRHTSLSAAWGHGNDLCGTSLAGDLSDR